MNSCPTPSCRYGLPGSTFSRSLSFSACCLVDPEVRVCGLLKRTPTQLRAATVYRTPLLQGSNLHGLLSFTAALTCVLGLQCRDLLFSNLRTKGGEKFSVGSLPTFSLSISLPSCFVNIIPYPGFVSKSFLNFSSNRRLLQSDLDEKKRFPLFLRRTSPGDEDCPKIDDFEQN